jgi:hypothetical protein
MKEISNFIEIIINIIAATFHDGENLTIAKVSTAQLAEQEENLQLKLTNNFEYQLQV